MTPVEAVDRLLAMPDDAADLRRRWAMVTDGNELARRLGTALRSSEWSDDCVLRWHAELDRWEERDPAFQSDRLREHQLNTARRILWCAKCAWTLEGRCPVHRRDIVGAPSFGLFFWQGDRDDEAWAFSHVHDLCAQARRPEAIVKVAVYDHLNEDAGLALLTTDIVDAGEGEVVRHPMDAFAAPPGEHFQTSMWDALTYAVQTSGGLMPPRHVRWRLSWIEARRRTRPDAEQLAETEGRSASGAASHALWHLLQEPKGSPSPGVIVFAQVSRHDRGRWDGVMNVPAKTSAVLAHNARCRSAAEYIDTIVVATERNKDEALEVIDDSGEPPGPQVRVLVRE